MSSGTFSARLADFSKRTQGRVNDVRREVILELFSSVIEDTPVLTGRLRGNWQTSIGSPKRGKIGLRPGPAATKEAQDTTLQLKGDDTIYLRNNLPYAIPIEYEGHSKQKAPAGMVRKNVARLTEIMQKKVRS